MSLAVVGLGRLGGSLASALGAAGEKPLLARRDPAGDPGLLTPELAVARADTVVLAVPDDALVLLASRLSWRAGQVVLHMSGRLGLEALAPARAAGAFRARVHPILALPTAPRADAFRGAYFHLEADAEALGAARDLVAALGGVPLATPPLDAAGRARYHAAAVFAGNFNLALVALGARLLMDLGASGEDAEAALLALQASAVRNAASAGVGAALTGPVVRGDAGTIAAHLAALDPETAACYRGLSAALLDVAVAGGRLDPNAAARLREALAPAASPTT